MTSVALNFHIPRGGETPKLITRVRSRSFAANSQWFLDSTKKKKPFSSRPKKIVKLTRWRIICTAPLSSRGDWLELNDLQKKNWRLVSGKLPAAYFDEMKKSSSRSTTWFIFRFVWRVPSNQQQAMGKAIKLAGDRVESAQQQKIRQTKEPAKSKAKNMGRRRRGTVMTVNP